MTSFENDLADCCICFFPLENPQALPSCGHTFCANCVSMLRTARCPLCRRVFEKTSGGPVCPGDLIQVDEDIVCTYKDTPELNYTLQRGLVGTVISVDYASDAQVRWEGRGVEWLLKKHWPKITVLAPHQAVKELLKVGSVVRVENEIGLRHLGCTQVDCVLPIGLEGTVVSISTDGDAEVRWDVQGVKRLAQSDFVNLKVLTQYELVKSRLRVGRRLRVDQTIFCTYKDFPDLNYRLDAGLHGTVISIDASGDATVRWDTVGMQWLLGSHFDRVTVLDQMQAVQERLKVGVAVKVEQEIVTFRLKSSAEKRIPCPVFPGVSGTVLSIHSDGEAEVRWDSTAGVTWLPQDAFANIAVLENWQLVKERIAVGEVVAVAEDIMCTYQDSPELNYTLGVGLRGSVRKLDSSGDALVAWDGLGDQWLLSVHFDSVVLPDLQC